MRMRKKDFANGRYTISKQKRTDSVRKILNDKHISIVRLLAVLRWDKKEQRLVEKCTQFKYEQIKKALHKECKSFND